MISLYVAIRLCLKIEVGKEIGTEIGRKAEAGHRG